MISAEKKQVHETPEKLTKLRQAYLFTCEALKEEFDIPLCILKGDDSIENITEHALDFIGKIL